MHRLLLALAVALAVVPSANAKGPDSAVVIGPGTIALVEPFAGKVEQALARLAPGEFPRKPFALVYVVRRYLPGEPARWFPGPGVLCDARARCAEAPELRGWFGSGRLTGLFRGEPLHIVSLMREGGRPLSRKRHARACDRARVRPGVLVGANGCAAGVHRAARAVGRFARLSPADVVLRRNERRRLCERQAVSALQPHRRAPHPLTEAISPASRAFCAISARLARSVRPPLSRCR